MIFNSNLPPCAYGNTQEKAYETPYTADTHTHTLTHLHIFKGHYTEHKHKLTFYNVCSGLFGMLKIIVCCAEDCFSDSPLPSLCLLYFSHESHNTPRVP